MSQVLSKTLEAGSRNDNKLNPHMAPGPGIEPRPHWWEASTLTTATSLLHEVGWFSRELTSVSHERQPEVKLYCHFCWTVSATCLRLGNSCFDDWWLAITDLMVSKRVLKKKKNQFGLPFAVHERLCLLCVTYDSSLGCLWCCRCPDCCFISLFWSRTR